MEDVNKLLSNLYICDDYVVLACSYGPDSMCLLDLLVKNNYNVVVAHVNHKLRKESDEEYTDLEKYCKDNNIIFEGTTFDNYPKGNTEAIARSMRYEFYKKIVNKYHAKYLFTAHHGDDLIETVLMRISRGASFRGYSGFRIITHTKDYDLVRPLIYLTKEEIMTYDKENNIPYAIDKTNLEDDLTRNKYRHKVLPILKEINPEIHKKFIKFSNTINEYNDYVEDVTNETYNRLYLNNCLDLNEFNLLHLLIKRTLLNKILLGIYNDEISKITDEHINLILDLIDSDKVNGYVCLPNNIKVTKFYNMLEFKYNETKKDFDLILKDKVLIDGGIIEKIDNTEIKKSNYLIRLNSREIKLPLHIRSRKFGDKISLKNFGTKKLSKIFIDSKMKMDERDTYPVVTDSDDNILWIPGVKKSKFDKTEIEEYDIILKYIKKGENYEK
jgi:tRNA(Ile)-lysidine synthase